MPETRTLRAYRVALDPTPAQAQAMSSHAGASRWAYNLAHAAKLESRRLWEERVREAIDGGADPAAARRSVRVKIPAAALIDKARVRVRGTDRAGNPTPPDCRVHDPRGWARR